MKLSEHIGRLFVKANVPLFVFLLLLIIPNILLGFTEGMPAAVAVLNVLLPLAVYYLLLTLTRRFGLSIWLFFPIIFLDAFQIVLLWLYGRSVIAVDMFLNLVTTNVGEVNELLSNMLPSIAIVVALYVPALVFGVWLMRRHIEISPEALRIHRRRALWTLGASLALLLVILFTSTPFSFVRDIFPANAVDNACLAVRHSIKTDRHSDLSAGFTFNAKADSTQTPEVLVMVIGETSRADHWQLNGYDRQTTPRLASDSLSGHLRSFPWTISESNTTHKSVPLMLSHLTPETYGDSIYVVKSLLSAFREAGYQTAFFSCQRHNRSFIDFFGEEADTTLFVREPDGLGLTDANDLTLLSCLDGMLRTRDRQRPLLVVLHTYGSHFSYRDRYPASMRRFVDDSYSEINAENRSRLIDGYDNTIVMTDSLLAGIVSRLKGLDAAMIYTSDHGEDILDDTRGLFLHASPCPTIYQVHVPLVVWESDLYTRRRPEAAAALDANRSKRVSSNTSYAATALDLGGVTTPRLGRRHSLINPAYEPAPRLYLNDHNNAVKLEESGFTDDDMVILSKFPR